MIVEVGIGALLFLMGYTVGRINLIHRLFEQKSSYLESPPKAKGWLSSNPEDKPSKMIDIDETRFVTDVSTDSFTSKHHGLGNKTVSQDHGMGTSVSKLKNLKERK